MPTRLLQPTATCGPAVARRSAFPQVRAACTSARCEAVNTVHTRTLGVRHRARSTTPPCACPVSVRQAGLACRTFSHPHQRIAEAIATSASVSNFQRDRCNVQDRNRECAHARPHDMRHGATPLLTYPWRRRVPNRAMQFWLREQLCEAINLANVHSSGAVLETNGKLQIDSEQCWRLGMTVSALVRSATRCSPESAQGRILGEVARRGVLIW